MTHHICLHRPCPVLAKYGGSLCNNVVGEMQACIMLLIAHMEGIENSWLTSATWDDFTQVSRPYKWYCAVYWVITTVSVEYVGRQHETNACTYVRLSTTAY